MQRFCLAALLIAFALPPLARAADPQPRAFDIDFGAEMGKVSPRVGFLGGLRDQTPNDLLQPLHPGLWRIGHQFRGRIAQGLPAAIDRVQDLGALYKLVMSDLIKTNTADWAAYEADVKKLVAQVGPRSSQIIWEPVNEPDIAHKPIDTYYEIYAHAFKALRQADPKARICGPGFAYPSYDKYKLFLDYCRQHNLECNYLAWHYTGWDADRPEQARWQLGRMRQFLNDYRDQKILEIHCDEWGAGPDKPGRLHPGRAVVWFHYLENVYQVDRACRANWGKADDYLGGIITPENQPYPVYHVYRLYGSTQGQTRVTVAGSDKAMACLASKSDSRREIILGSIAPTAQPVVLRIRNLGLEPFLLKLTLIPNQNLDQPLSASQLPAATEYTVSREDGKLILTLKKVEENQAYHLLFARP